MTSTREALPGTPPSQIRSTPVTGKSDRQDEPPVPPHPQPSARDGDEPDAPRERAGSETDAATSPSNADSVRRADSPSKKRPLNGMLSASPAPASSQSEHAASPSAHPSSSPTASDTPESGRRKRKKTRVFEIPGPTFVRKISTGAKGVSGRGVKLSAIPNIVYTLDKCTPKDPEIEFLHRLLFNTAGTMIKRKTNIRAFSGFVFTSEKDRRRVRDKLQRGTLHMVRRIAALLDVSVKEARVSKANNGGSPGAAQGMVMSGAGNTNGQVGNDTNAEARGISSGQEKRNTNVLGGTSGGAAADGTTGAGISQDVNQEASVSVSEEKARAEKLEARQKREEVTRITKEETVKAILKFLEMPKVIEGRVSLAQREKELKRQKKALEKAKAAKLAAKKAAEKLKRLEQQKKAVESDDDGDEDLENGAKPWIVLARERKELEELQAHQKQSNREVMANGHG